MLGFYLGSVWVQPAVEEGDADVPPLLPGPRSHRHGYEPSYK